MRGHDHIVLVHANVADADARQVELQRLPVRTVVERGVDACFGAGEEQSLPLYIAANRARVGAHGNAGINARPRCAVVGGLEQVGCEVILLVPIGGEVRRAGVEGRRLDDRHARELSEGFGRHVLPRAGAVRRDVHEAVVAAGPEHARLHRRFGEGEDRGVPLGARHVAAHRSATAPHGVRVGQCEIAGDPVPRRALVLRAPYVLRGRVQRARIVQREVDREGPLEALRHVFHSDAIVVAEPHRYVATRVGALVVARELTHVAATEGHVWILRIDGDVGVLAPRHRKPVTLADEAVVRPAGDRNRTVVLLCTIKAIRLLIVGRDVVKLRRGLITLRAPRTAAVQRDGRAAIVAVDETVRIFRVDPHDVRVAVRHSHRRERAAAVYRAMHGEIHDVHGVLVHRVRREAHVVEGPHDELLIAAGARPCGAGIVGAEHAAQRILCFDVRVHTLRIGGRHRDADLADQAFRHARIEGEFGPGITAIGALPQATASGAGVHAPGGTLKLPHRRIHDSWVVHVDRQVGSAGAVIQEQHLLPGGTAVGGAKHAAVGRRTKGMTQRCHKGDIGIGGVHAQRRDLLRIGHAARRPRLTAVGGSVHTRAVGQVFTGLAFARTHPDHIGVTRGHRDRTDRRNIGFAVGDVLPRLPGVDGLPHAAVDGAEVEDEGLGGVAGHGGGPAPARGTNIAPAQ